MTEDVIRLPKLHAGQMVVRQSPARFKWLSAGRRWRKTTLGMDVIAAAASSHPLLFWGAPTYDQCRVAWDELYHAAGGVASFNLGRMEVTFPKPGGKIIFRSLDNPDNARGHTAYGLVIDEAPLCHPHSWMEVLRPVLSDTQGWALFLGTPSGRNWFWREFVAARDQADSQSWSCPTLGVEIVDGRLVRAPHPLENPFFPFQEAERMYTSMPERTFRQEFLAEFLDDGGGVFRRVREAAIAVRQERGIAHRPYVIGVDWGKHEDFTVCAVIDLEQRSCVALERMREIDYMLQVQRLQVLVEKFRPKRIIAERTGIGEPIIEHLHRLGLPVSAFNTTVESKRTAIEALSLAFERSAIRILRDEVLIGELEAYQTERLPSGLLRYSAPEGMHDDCVMALAMAWQAVSDTPTARIDLKHLPQPTWR